MRIVADIGGTHARFAVLDGDKPNQIKKYLADSFHTFDEAFFVYCKELKIENPTHMAIATAGYPSRQAGQTVWRFVNNNSWVINPEEFSKSGVEIDLILNDFEAALWGLKALPDDQLKTLHQGRAQPDQNFNRCLLGAGTGLGLGYLINAPQSEDDWHVQRTHGGHSMAACLTDEHTVVVKTVSRFKPDGGITVFENLASGPGIFTLYQAQCLMAGQPSNFQSVPELFDNLQSPHVKDALRLFHEFLGVFSHSAVVNGHAYDGLYLTGGVIDRLVAADLFDVAHFQKFLNLNGVASVKRDIANMPIHYVTNQYLALYGLKAALESA